MAKLRKSKQKTVTETSLVPEVERHEKELEEMISTAEKECAERVQKVRADLESSRVAAQSDLEREIEEKRERRISEIRAENEEFIARAEEQAAGMLESARAKIAEAANAVVDAVLGRTEAGTEPRGTGL